MSIVVTVCTSENSYSNTAKALILKGFRVQDLRLVLYNLSLTLRKLLHAKLLLVVSAKEQKMPKHLTYKGLRAS